MSKRRNEFEDDVSYNTLNKKHKIHKTNINYITVIINDASFYQFSLDELRETSNEISQIINKILIHKQKIDSILSIYC